MEVYYGGSSMWGSFAPQIKFGKWRQRERKTAIPILQLPTKGIQTIRTVYLARGRLQKLFLSSFNASRLILPIYFLKSYDGFTSPYSTCHPHPHEASSIPDAQWSSDCSGSGGRETTGFAGGRHVHTPSIPFLRPLGVAFLVVKLGRPWSGDKCDFCFFEKKEEGGRKGNKELAGVSVFSFQFTR